MNPAEVAQRWANRLMLYVRLGLLCWGCGYRIAAENWLINPETQRLTCPYCYTVRGTR